MGLRQEWQRIEGLTDDLHQAADNASPEAGALWQQRQKLLEALLNEATLASLAPADVAWLQDQSQRLAQRDRTLQQELNEQQHEIQQQLRQRAGNRKAAKAYRNQI